MSRKFTNRLLEGIEEGLFDRDTVIMACVKYMSEDDVEDMMHLNEMNALGDYPRKPLASNMEEE